MYFELSEEHILMRDTIRKFLEKELVPIVEEIDANEEFPLEPYKKLGEMGFIGLHVPEEYGGGGADFLGKCVVAEEIARVSAGFQMSVDLSGAIYANPILKFGNDEQKKKYLPPVLSGEKLGAWCLTEPDSGSDALSIKTSRPPIPGDDSVGCHHVVGLGIIGIIDHVGVVVKHSQRDSQRGVPGGETAIVRPIHLPRFLADLTIERP